MSRSTFADHHPGDYGVATAASGAASLFATSGQVTSESLTTAAGSQYTLTVTNRRAATNSPVFCSVQLGTSTTGLPQVVTVSQSTSDGAFVVVVKNIDGSNPFNGTIIVSFYIPT